MAAIWVKSFNDEHSRYFYHQPEANKSVWEAPSGNVVVWTRREGPNGEVQYENEATGQFSADLPQELHGFVGGGTAEADETQRQQAQQQAQHQAQQEHEQQPAWKFSLCFISPRQKERATEQPPESPRSESAGEWVEETEQGRTYYWDLKTLRSTATLPSEGVCWRACRQSAGDPAYYMNVKSGGVSWRMPDAPLSSPEGCSENPWARIGAALTIFGLESQTRFNGHHVRLLSFHKGRALVQMPDILGGHVLLVSPDKLRPLDLGALVHFRDASPDEAGTIWGHHDEGFHYLVLRNTQEYVWVKPDDVIPRCRCFDMELQKGLGWLQWRKEQSCRFFDSKGEERHYYIQFPLQFLHSAEEKRRWPLLLYLHGVGGCSFFTHTKKSLKSPGMHHAAKHFIVVSPHCTWGWRDRPLTWVHELIAELRAASYVDDTRIYMAGNSMGGMGTWYLASERPDLYAAIALVSAYHHEGGLETIPEALSEIPVIVVHSYADETCELKKEEPLWRKFKERGGSIEIHLATGIGHTFMFDAAFCEDTRLYSLLLRFTKP